MELLPITSIFRRIPSALALKQRRLIGAMGYAIDGAELSYARIKISAEQYILPAPGSQPDTELWSPNARVALVVDSWAFIDHINRMRKLLDRFDVDPSQPISVIEAFREATKPANKIRNRLQHLDEDIFDGKNESNGHPVLGQVGWIDNRPNGDFVRYSISTGPTIDGGQMARMEIPATFPSGVGGFELMASDLLVDLTSLYGAFRTFVTEFEPLLHRSIVGGIKLAAIEKGIEFPQTLDNPPCDMTFAMTFSPEEGETWTMKPDQSFGMVEVSLNTFEIERSV